MYEHIENMSTQIRKFEKANITKHTYPVVDPYQPLLALPQKAG